MVTTDHMTTEAEATATTDKGAGSSKAPYNCSKTSKSEDTAVAKLLPSHLP